MKILVCGANGFIGRHICDALQVAGHQLVRGVRLAQNDAELSIDYTRDTDASSWLQRLHQVDVVINAVGILIEDGTCTFDAIHRDAPIALFDACAKTGVKTVIQISALSGGDSCAWTPYMRSKRAADAFLEGTALDWLILRPSLVVGINGSSSRLFRTLASLPVIGLPGTGTQLLQPVHIDDLCEAVLCLLQPGIETRRIIDVVGPVAMTYRSMLLSYREAMQLAPPVWMRVPMQVMRMTARLAARLPQRVLAPDTLRMLEDENVADPANFSRVLGRLPKGAGTWFSGTTPAMLRADALSVWTMPLLRVALATVWMVTGLLAVGIYPVEQSLVLLGEIGLEGRAASTVLYGAAVLDCALGIATLVTPGRLLWRSQIALVLAYTVIISFFLPAFWLHPFGPLLKNIPILALLLVLDATEFRKA